MFLVWPTKFEKYFEFYAQLICWLKKKKGDCLKSKFLGELGFKSWVCENQFISYSYIFFHIFSMLWGEVASNSVDFKKFFFFFYNFDRSSLFFNQSKLRLKISVSLYLFRLIETVFRLIEFHESGFLKFNVWPVQNTFSKVFSTFLSLSDSAKQNHPIFVIFLWIFCKVFLFQSQ